jgi:hypothetical protein
MFQYIINKKIKQIKEDINIDAFIKKYLIILNENGYCTEGSCSGLRNEHINRHRYTPFVTINVYVWAALKSVCDLNRILYGTGWKARLMCGIMWETIEGSEEKYNFKYFISRYGDEKYDYISACIALEYDRNKSDEKIRKAWNILIEKLVSGNHLI